MDEKSLENAPPAATASEEGKPFEATPANSANPPDHPPSSTSALSPAPTPDAPNPSGATEDKIDPVSTSPSQRTAAPSFQQPQFSAQTESILKRINENAASAAAAGTPGWEAAREQVMREMQTSNKFPTPPPPKEGLPPQATGDSAVGINTNAATSKSEVDTTQATPASTSVRGRGGGRPRGRGRGGGRSAKRKRERSDDELSDDSEVYTPAATTTKSGRSVQKPTAFVPPPASPPSSNKRKRVYRKNPESAVCKICLRGTSPANNMIVFCDGCNSPYHRFCHHPPIDQAVVDEVDKEWYCKQCEKERVAPVPESVVADFISAEGAPVEQRQRYFASLSPGMLVTLLTRATTLRPDLPVFAPDFRARIGSMSGPPQVPMGPTPSSNGHSHPQPMQHHAPHGRSYAATTYSSQYSGQHPSAHAIQQPPPQYMQAYPNPAYGPDVHPPHYPRPGHGMMRTLPPEQEDLQWLVDDNDRYGVYSHMYSVGAQMNNPGMNGLAGRHPQ